MIVNLDIFQMAVNTAPNEGYAVLQYNMAEGGNPTLITYESQEEFNQDFQIGRHPYYPCNRLNPVNVTQDYGDSCDCIIQGGQFHLDKLNIYLIVNGRIQR